jgi:hypothetical protein
MGIYKLHRKSIEKTFLAEEADCGLEAIKRQQEIGGLYFCVPATSQMDS